MVKVFLELTARTLIIDLGQPKRVAPWLCC